ncbi:hypothetical protein D3C75_1125670 [compost metagenome]
MSLLLPGKVYEYITTAAGLMLLYNWAFILLSSGKLLKPAKLSGFKRWTGLVLIAAAVAGSLFHKISRPGFYISLLLIALIGASDLIVHKVRKKGNTSSSGDSSSEEQENQLQRLAGGPQFKIKGIRMRMRKSRL